MEDAALCSPVHPAIELIPEHDELEKELTDIESALLADSMKVSPEHPAQVETPVLARSEEVSTVIEKSRTLTEAGRQATVGDLLNLMHEAENLARDQSISIAEQFILRRIVDAIMDTLDSTTAIPDSPEREKLRQDRARYKQVFSAEFELLLDRFCENASAENTKALGDNLFPKQHRARLSAILDNATDPQRATYAELFADWVHLKEYSPSQVAECVEVDLIQRLTSQQSK